MRKMNGENERDVREFLKSKVPRAQTELRRDLWPAMLRRLDERPRRVAWIDWALVATIAGLLLLFPKAIPMLMYHL
jgi:hypothetical protein